MTGWRKRTIIEMAREAGFNVEQGFLLRITGIDEDLERFAALVREEERDRIAKWYENEGHMMFPIAIPKAIRSGK